LLLDRDFEVGEEPVKVCVKNNKLVEFRKELAKDIEYDLIGESVGFFRFTNEMINNLVRETNEYIDRNSLDEPYEEVIRDLILEYPDDFYFEDITGTPWLEIDFPKDVHKVETDILPALSMGNE
jgi:choline kinase